MGYEYHITRAENWADNADVQITPDEWLAVVDADAELSITGVNGPYFADWRHSWFDLVDGNVTTKNPDEETLNKMLSLAVHFGARVQGDEGDIYDGSQVSDSYTPPNALLAWLRFLGVYFLVLLVLCLISALVGYLFGMYDM